MPTAYTAESLRLDAAWDEIRAAARQNTENAQTNKIIAGDNLTFARRCKIHAIINAITSFVVCGLLVFWALKLHC